MVVLNANGAQTGAAREEEEKKQAESTRAHDLWRESAERLREETRTVLIGLPRFGAFTCLF